MHNVSTVSFLAAADDSPGGGILQFGILLLIPLAMYFLLIRPQRKRMKSQQSMQSSLGVGDEVVTTSGVYGFITGEESDLFWLEIDDDVQIRVAKAAIASKVAVSDTEAKPKPDGKPKPDADEADPDWEPPADDG